MAEDYVSSSSPLVSTPTRHDTTDTTSRPWFSLRDVARELGQSFTTVERLYQDATDGGDE